ncbi:MAG TPA: hypothetical protein VHN15_11040 [Thermoanaerobaculia bacterium]|nr:hypothetical protein [Thermoanaerobaculia bacterium]
MRGPNPRRSRLATLVPGIGLLAVLGLLSPGDVCSYGCSRVEDHRAGLGSCLPSSGSACYECYYVEGGGFRTCWENPEGTRSYCIDHQNPSF